MSDVIRRNGDALKAITCRKLLHCQREARALHRNYFYFYLQPKSRRMLVRKTEDIDNDYVESAAELRYSAIINPLRGGHVRSL